MKLARYSFFGTDLMKISSVYGCKGQQPLPAEKVVAIKALIASLLPQYAATPYMFEAVWKKCVGAINHACSKLRK